MNQRYITLIIITLDIDIRLLSINISCVFQKLIEITLHTNLCDMVLELISWGYALAFRYALAFPD